jgi:hypothetical protein
MKLGDFLLGVGRPVAYFPAIARIVGVKECVFLCQLIYWHDKAEEGWIYKTQEEFTEETGLSRSEQETARRNLKRTGLLEERHERLRHRMFYRVNLDALETIWNLPNAGKSHSGMLDLDARGGENPAPAIGQTPHSSLGTETTAKTTTKRNEMPAIPFILQSPEFAIAWEDWLVYRREAKKPVTPTTAKAQLKMLEGLGVGRAILSVRNSIQNQWQGLFEPRDQLPPRNGNSISRQNNGRAFSQNTDVDFDAIAARTGSGT